MPIAPWTWLMRLWSEPPSESASAKSSRSIAKIFPSIAFTTASDPCFSPDAQRPPFAVYGPRSAPSLLSAAFWSAAVLPPAFTPSKQARCPRSARACAWTLEFIFEGRSATSRESKRQEAESYATPESSFLRARAKLAIAKCTRRCRLRRVLTCLACQCFSCFGRKPDDLCSERLDGIHRVRSFFERAVAVSLEVHRPDHLFAERFEQLRVQVLTFNRLSANVKLCGADVHAGHVGPGARLCGGFRLKTDEQAMRWHGQADGKDKHQDVKNASPNDAEIRQISYRRRWAVPLPRD